MVDLPQSAGRVGMAPLLHDRMDGLAVLLTRIVVSENAAKDVLVHASVPGERRPARGHGKIVGYLGVVGHVGRKG